MIGHNPTLVPCSNSCLGLCLTSILYKESSSKVLEEMLWKNFQRHTRKAVYVPGNQTTLVNKLVASLLFYMKMVCREKTEGANASMFTFLVTVSEGNNNWREIVICLIDTNCILSGEVSALEQAKPFCLQCISILGSLKKPHCCVLI